MNMLELRNQMKKKKPQFIRQDAHKKRLKKRWIRPRGLHSKVRLKKAGHPKRVSCGYRAPNQVRGLSKEGLVTKLIFNDEGLNDINKEKEGVIIASCVGLKNKIVLLKKAKEKGIKILNINVDEYLKKKEEEIKKRLEEKKKKREKKKEKVKEKEGKKEDKLEEKLSDEEKQELEKKEKDRLLTKREK